MTQSHIESCELSPRPSTPCRPRAIQFGIGLLLLVSLSSVHTSTCNGQIPSLFERSQGTYTSQFADLRAVKPGDLLFVTINEQSDVQNRDQRLMQKQNASSSEASGSFATGASAGDIGVDHASASNRSVNGNAQYISEREFLDGFTVTVLDTLTNGNLIIRGRRKVNLEGDLRTLVLTGVVRHYDVSANNMISSRSIADLVIRYETDAEQGAERKFVNQGWLGKKLNKFWPF